MGILWIGHEADSYILASATQTEQGNAILSPQERTGMRVGRSGGGIILSAPDWVAVNDFWHGWRSNGSISVNEQLWIGYTAAGTAVARIIAATTATGQFQIWSGTVWTNIGGTFALVGGTAKNDLHFVPAVSGRIEFYYGNAGSQTKVLDLTGDYSAAANIVRIGHDGNTTGGGFDNDVAHEIVQTTSTLNTTSEIKPPTSDGADTDGGVGGWANVDEVTYSDADYIALAAVGKRQSFKAIARTTTQASVTGVTASCRAWYEGGGPTNIKPYVTLGGVRYYGTTFALDVIPKAYQYTWQVDPSTGVAWTAATANSAALEWGWEAA